MFGGVELSDDKLRQLVGAANEAAMRRASAFLMRVAQRKIRYRRYGTVSKKGDPPFKHTTGQQSFSHAIKFLVEDHGASAVIGPTRKPNGTIGAFGGTVPNTLEFGGYTPKGWTAGGWYRGDVAAAGLRTESAIADWALRVGFGPIFAGENETSVINQIAQYDEGRQLTRREISRRRKADPRARIFRDIYKRDLWKGKTKEEGIRRVYLADFSVRTPHQARKAAANIVKFFGVPKVGPFEVAARPFMGPTLQEHLADLSGFWRDRLAYGNLS